MKKLLVWVWLVSAFLVRPAWAAAPVSTTPVEHPAFQAFLSPAIDAELYQIKPGDTLGSIAAGHGVTVEVLKRVNALTGKRLIAGRRLKIPRFKLNVEIDKSENTLTLKADDVLLKTYVVATGAGNRTPVGTFRVQDKIERPTWYKDDGAVIRYGEPGHLLGTRWIGLSEKGYGIHGTTEPEKLGRQVSHGCVRMRNEEVEEIFTLLPYGATITITD